MCFQNERSTDVRKRLEKKMKKSTKTKDIDQTMIDEEIARMLPGKMKIDKLICISIFVLFFSS